MALRARVGVLKTMNEFRLTVDPDDFHFGDEDIYDIEQCPNCGGSVSEVGADEYGNCGSEEIMCEKCGWNFALVRYAFEWFEDENGNYRFGRYPFDSDE